MLIAAVDHRLPSREISNEWILERIRVENRAALTPTELANLEAQVENLLRIAGTEMRYQLADGESAIGLGVDAARGALDRAGMDPGDIDCLIYAGVGRGWIEPATAHVFQSALGLAHADCFDVLDACASWLRAVSLAHALLHSGRRKRILVLNAECGFRTFGHWRMQGPEDLDHLFATCTIGEAATATVLTDDRPDDDWYFTFRALGQHARLSLIPLPTLADFGDTPFDERLQPLKFFSLSRELLTAATREMIETYRADPVLRQGSYDLAVGHAASERASLAIARKIGIPPEIYFPTHPAYGNTVSASVPLALSLAERQGRLRRGSKVLAGVGAAGLTIGYATFTY